MGIDEGKELKRLEALKSYSIDYGIKEDRFDNLTKLAASICETPAAFISLIDENDQWIKSSYGLAATRTPREVSFCQFALLSEDILEVEDALKDPRFSNNPLVTGKPFIRYYAGAPLIDSDGYILGTICVIDHKVNNLNAFQLESLKTLSKTVINLFEYSKNQKLLAEAVMKEKQAINAKSDFLSTISHEIRTPLNGIIGMTHLLLDESPREDQLQYLKTIKFSSDNLMLLINDILDYSKIEAGMIKPEEIQFNLDELLSHMKKVNHQIAEDKSIQLKLRKDDDIPKLVIGDPLRLSQILNNLISNAIKFTKEGSVTIEAELLSKQEKSANILFSVKDTGIGIDADKHQIIFERFQQADTSISRNFGGTGLGLSISKKLLKLMGSDIQLKSELNVGSDFSFELELKLPKSKNQEKIFNNNFEPFTHGKILLVDDNMVNIMIAKKLFEKWQLKVTTAQSGVEALKKVQLEDFDIIFMDLFMPELDGYQTTMEIRKLGGKFTDLPIIALSSSVYSFVEKSLRDASLTDFISKPFNPEQLYQKVEFYLNCQTQSQAPLMVASI